jgi:hypothetical protein
MNNVFITRDDMVEYVKARLGFPCLDIELDLEEKNGLGHVHLAINDSLDYMFRHSQDEADYHDWMVLYARAGIIEYTLPEGVTDVIDAAPTFGNGMTPWTSFDVGAYESLVSTTGWSQFDLVTYVAAQRYLSDVKKLVGTVYQVRYHPTSRKLRIIPTPKQDRAIMVKIYRKESISEIFNMINFRDLVIARTKVILGEIVTKYDYQLPGGGKINGDRILTDARADLEKMEKKIAEEAARPFIMTDLDL